MQKVTVMLVDDLDGTSEAQETVSFGLDGVAYEIDLTNQHAAELREALSAYAASARRTGGRAARIGSRRPVTASTTGAARTREETQAIRAWALANGHTVADRGRIPDAVIQAYQARDLRPSTPKEQPAATAPTEEAHTPATTAVTTEPAEPKAPRTARRKATPKATTSPVSGDEKPSARSRRPRSAAGAGKMATT